MALVITIIIIEKYFSDKINILTLKKANIDCHKYYVFSCESPHKYYTSIDDINM